MARGPLRREDPLQLTLLDEGRPVCRLVFDDWAAQASTALSPTAGWGVPVNAVEFRRLDERESSAVGIWLTLAATGIGRGWDSVGPAPGLYRNRMHVESIGN